MDNVTHTLFAATLARTPLGRAGPGATAALILASNAPDVDIITAFSGGAAAYLTMHRGPTHGPLGVAMLAIATAALVRLVDDRAHFGRLLAVSGVGVLLHVLMDLPTSYGTRIWSPFSPVWYAVDWLPIIDIYLLALLFTGVLMSWWRRDAGARIAAGILVIMVGYYALRAGSHAVAVRRAFDEQTAAGICEIASIASWTPPGPEPGGSCLKLAVIPGFTSPFRWRVIREHPDGYELKELDLMGTSTAPVWFPIDRDRWTELARSTPMGRTFLDFARLPGTRSILDRDADIVAVRIADMRFVGSRFALAENGKPLEGRGFFTVTVRIDPRGQIIEQKLGAE